jgi:hypothetical protein
MADPLTAKVVLTFPYANPPVIPVAVVPSWNSSGGDDEIYGVSGVVTDAETYVGLPN